MMSTVFNYVGREDMRKHKQILVPILMAFWGTVGSAGFAVAAELPAGTVIDAANVEKVKGDTFEGKTIASMLTEKLEWQVKNYALKIKLRHSEEVPRNPQEIEATKKYAGQVKFDPSTNEVTGYMAVIPFPDISPSDPKAGFKLLYNYYYANPSGTVLKADLVFILVDGEKGFERVQKWTNYRYVMKNRIMRDTPVAGDGKILSKTALYATAPYDIKGLGHFSIRYDSPRVEDIWVYVKSVRRTRKLSGGSWMDTMVGDQLLDEYDIWNARPSWYPDAKLVGKRWVLASLHTKLPYVDVTKGDSPERYKYIDVKNAPYWNPLVEWEPREVYVLDITPPQAHSYGKKILYMDTKFPRFHMAEYYDKRGDFWKFQQSIPCIGKAPLNGFIGIGPCQGHTIDFKRKHATIYVVGAGSDYPFDTIQGSPDDVTLGLFEAAGGG